MPSLAGWIHASLASCCLCGASALACGSLDDAESVRLAQALLNDWLSRPAPPEEIYSHHAVLSVPTSPRTACSGFAGEAYASLPRVVSGRNSTTTFTKFVVVGNAAPAANPVGLALGDDACGASGHTDPLAAEFFRVKVPQQLKAFAPNVVQCGTGGFQCHGSEGLDNQLPFLTALLGEGRSLRGNMLPILLQGQDIRLGARLGDALSLLVQPGGVWEAEKVLFVFAGDLSQGMQPAPAKLCDSRAAEALAERGVPQIADYFDALLAGRASEGCQGARAVPRGFGPLLAAARVAARLRLRSRRTRVAHSNDYVNPLSGKKETWLSLGYGAILYWEDSRTVWERLGAKARPALVAQHAAADDDKDISRHRRALRQSRAAAATAMV